MKVSVRLGDVHKHKGISFQLNAKRLFLATNQWHKVTFIAAEKTGFSLFIDDELMSSYTITNKLLCTALKDTKESHNIVRFGRGVRNYPGFTGCVRDVYVNNVRGNFSVHDSSGGILVGKCNEIFINKPSLTEETTNLKGESTSSLNSTLGSVVVTKSSEGRVFETWTEAPVPSDGSSNPSGTVYETISPGLTPFSKRNSSLDKAYTIALALAVGLLIVLIVTAYVFGVGVKCRLQNCRDKMIKETDESKLSIMLQNRRYDGSYSKNLRVSGKTDHERHSDCSLHVPITGNHSCCQDIYRSPRGTNQNPMKVWEDRYLNNANKTFDSNVLTVPQIHSTHVYQTLEAQSQEKVSLNTHGNVIGSTNIPPPNESVALEKHNLDRGFLDPVIDYPNGDKGRRIPTVVNSLIPKPVDKVYSGYDSLPRPRKTPSLSWAYRTRFVRHVHESSHTDCSEIDRATRAQKRNPHVIKSGRVIAIRPRHLTVLESSEDERGCSRIWNRSRYGESGRVRTFTQQTYKLHSLKEEEGEADVEQRMSLTCNKLKVYCRTE